MSTFTDRLAARRRELGLTVQALHTALNLRGVDIGYAAVASWLNGQRGEQWDPVALQAVLEVLQTDLATMVGSGRPSVPDLTDPLLDATVRTIATLTSAQRAAVLSLITAFQRDQAA